MEEHVLTQASLQHFVDNSISKTVNFPETTTVEDVRNAYLSAWSLGCKGLTVYVTGSRHNVVLETKSAKKNLEEKDKAAAAAAAAGKAPEAQPPRPETPPTDTEGSSCEEDDDEEESNSDIEKSPTPQKQSSSFASSKTGAAVPSLSNIGPFLKKRPRPTHLQG